MMKEQLRAYIDDLFTGVERTRYTDELRDELLADLNSHYDDCVSRGMSETEAYGEAIRNAGDMHELIEEAKNKAVTVGGISDMPYISTPRIDLSGRGNGFFRNITPENEKTILGTITAIFWLVVVGVYFFTSFLFQNWDWSWLIFIAASAVNVLLDLAFDLNKLKREPYTVKIHNKILNKICGAFSAVLWLVTVIVYFVISFLFGIWDISWLIFIVSTILQLILNAFIKLSKK
ncbi:MAG: permease prefix domain 1-containing protein [Huintestinicola sp.]